MSVIHQLMSKNIVCLSCEDTVLHAINVMRDHNIGAVLVKQEEEPIGIFTERDLLIKLDFNNTPQIHILKMKDVMTTNLQTVGHEDDYEGVINLMRRMNIRHAPVEKDGKIIGIISLRDLITQYEDYLKSLVEKNHKQLLETLNKVKESEAALERVLTIRTEFTNKVSHELRTPLASIKGAVDLVLRGTAGSLSDDQKDILNRAKNNIDRLKRLLDDILDLSKLESGAVQLNIQSQDINKVIKEVVESQKIIIQQKGLYLKFSLDRQLPPVPFDLDNFSQVLCNLINNATKFTEKGGITVSTQYQHQKNQAVICVQDTGQGIHEQDIPKLFGKFQQVRDKSAPQMGGTGLGLAICKEIVHQHGGEIWAESTWQEGSTFCFTLPIQQNS